MAALYSLLTCILVALWAIRPGTCAPKQYTIGLFCLAVDHEMEKLIHARLKATSPDSPRYGDLLKTLCRIPSTYMKFLNLRGISFVPIFYNNNEKAAYLDQMDDIDGVLLIGGTVYAKYKPIQLGEEESGYSAYRLDTSPYNEYYDTVAKIIEKAKAINDGGRKFLLIGVCVGFQSIIMADTKFKPQLYLIKNSNHQRPIYFDLPTGDNSSSRIKAFIGPENAELFASHSSAFFFHNYGMSLDNFVADPGIYTDYVPVATFRMDTAKQPRDFVAAYEHRRYPFFGLQFHPEKILFETHPSMSKLERNDVTTQLSALFVDFIYSELDTGAAGRAVPLDHIQKYSCPRYKFYDLMIFHEVFVYDCLDFLGRNWNEPPATAK